MTVGVPYQWYFCGSAGVCAAQVRKTRHCAGFLREGPTGKWTRKHQVVLVSSYNTAAVPLVSSCSTLWACLR